MTPARELETQNQHRLLAASGVRQRGVILTRQQGVILSEAKDLSL
jgi:hypothetical protein